MHGLRNLIVGDTSVLFGFSAAAVVAVIYLIVKFLGKNDPVRDAKRELVDFAAWVVPAFIVGMVAGFFILYH